jgi:hypothetical protein
MVMNQGIDIIGLDTRLDHTFHQSHGFESQLPGLFDRLYIRLTFEKNFVVSPVPFFQVILFRKSLA